VGGLVGEWNWLQQRTVGSSGFGIKIRKVRSMSKLGCEIEDLPNAPAAPPESEPYMVSWKCEIKVIQSNTISPRLRSESVPTYGARRTRC
jgi:hypothetical protein